MLLSRAGKDDRILVVEVEGARTGADVVFVANEGEKMTLPLVGPPSMKLRRGDRLSLMVLDGAGSGSTRKLSLFSPSVFTRPEIISTHPSRSLASAAKKV
eukprot:TRINITY_DN13737_c0_g1_i1.p2 TRINITY_DN13737_c0_g1~~TRINITY_DN13737_c0_g1_i1.p2  ORF type:complete len:100 (-),score=10.65 TRINITY_DN13737_c0_g1_i1:124-423(-)